MNEPSSRPISFIDLQVNGYGGVDFNSCETSTEDIGRACQKLRDDNVEGILATVITDDVEKMSQRIKKLSRACAESDLVNDVIKGIHIEGPFISSKPGFVGAHPVAHVIPADINIAKTLVEAAGGLTRIMTLAPESDPNRETIRFLIDSGIIVSAGHCDPDLETLESAIDAGLSMFTHLGNACPSSVPRHNNVIQRVLSLSDRLTIGFIADGIHIPYFALKNYLAVAGFDRIVRRLRRNFSCGLRSGKVLPGWARSHRG